MEENSSTSNSRRALLRFLAPMILVLIAACVVLDPVITRVFVFSNEVHGAAKVHRMFDEVHPGEIPILGSSRADGSFVPDLIHPDAYNYGIQQAGYTVTRMMLETELRKQSTTPIIINFEYTFFHEQVADIANFIPSLGHPEVRPCMGDRQRWFHRIPLLRYFGHMDDYFRSFLADRSTRNVRSRGAFFLTAPFSREAFERTVSQRRSTRFGWNGEWPARDAWVELLGSTERPIAVVVAPYHPAWMESFTTPEAGQAYLARMDALPNVTVIDLGAMPLPDSCFLNPRQLHRGEGVQQGARATAQ